jgi:riboflavin synthase
MFTGLVETTGTVRSVERRGASSPPVGPGARMRLAVALGGGAAVLGESIAVSGVCLTVVASHADGFEADVSAETLAVTTLGDLEVSSRVNVERSLQVGDRMGGHWVMGHVDGVGTVARLDPVGEAKLFGVEVPEGLLRFFAAKGSICIDGVSLTVNRVVARTVEIMLVPHTLAVTTLGRLRVGSRVNLEVDVLSRYVARQLEHAGILSTDDADARIMDALQQGGYLS